jgi:toxin HigB-1
MEIRFATKDLEALYTEESGAESYPPEVVDAFFRRMQFICSANDERDVRALKSAHFEKLKGETDRFSVRLNKQWRLILTFDPPRGPHKVVVILEISKHYGD